MKNLVKGMTALTVLMTGTAHADMKIGAVLSMTGPAASLGIPAANTLKLLPTKIGDQNVQFIVLDDGSQPANAVRDLRKLIDEDKVDVIIGPSITPTSLAGLEVIGPAKTPTISLSGSTSIAAPVQGNKEWMFELVPSEATQAAYIFKNMKDDKLKTVAFVGFNDAFGDAYIGAVKKVAIADGFTVTGDERYGRADSSVTAQALKLMSGKPDAVIVGASGTPGLTPVLELRKLGYKGQIYLNQGMANADVLKLGGKTIEGMFMPVSPDLVAEQLPDSNPAKAAGIAYDKAYEGKYGAGSRSLFGATAWDAYQIIANAVPKAEAKAKPGTVEFRTALRDAMQQTTDLAGAEGVFSMSPTNHNGTDLRAELLVEVKGGNWVYKPLDASK
ncbi:MAG: ABC transporter substrate-binding protein [Hyphomicrobiales bacterium]|nr:ABC transporter substrate-binding protein [Hyphomicrobiales bacterium]MDE2113698.1 ABC transporter substrate-binding protein [Hyphomicrobiales bacterium]